MNPLSSSRSRAAIARAVEALEPLEQRRLLAGIGPHLLVDANTGGSFTFFQYAPVASGAGGATLFFTAEDQSHGIELWKTDGTTGGESLLKDINPGPASSDIGQMVNLSGTLLFFADDGVNGAALWKSDGTTAGTQLLKDIRATVPGPDEEDGWGSELTVIGTNVYFSAEDGIHGRELWKSNGTAAGTQLVKDIDGNGAEGSFPQNLAAVGSQLFFNASDPLHGAELWTSDGTEGGTHMVTELMPGPDGSGVFNLTPFNGALYFVADTPAGEGLWKSDGTEPGTVPAGPAPSGGTSIAGVAGSFMYFKQSGALWRTAGTPGDALGLYSGSASDFGAAGSRLYFSGQDAAHGVEPWSTDGTVEGTGLLKDVRGGSDDSFPTFVGAIGGTAYFTAQAGNNTYALFQTDGSEAGTSIVLGAGVQVASVDFQRGTTIGSSFYFNAFDPLNGSSLWKIPAVGSAPVRLAALSTRTQPSNPSPLFRGGDGDLLFFFARDANGVAHMWQTDGTTGGTVNLGVDGGSPYWLNDPAPRIGGFTYFVGYDAAHGAELWKTNGTPGGTSRVADIRPGTEGSQVFAMVAFNGKVFFQANDGVHGFEIWSSDGTEQGTQMLADLVPPTGFWALPLGVARGKLFIAADNADQKTDLYVSDGTAGGTQLIFAGPAVFPSNGFYYPTVLNDTLLFYTDDGVHGTELWRSDGTALGTQLVADISSGPAHTFQDQSLIIDGIEYFIIQHNGAGGGGRELWRTDGTSAGTFFLETVEPTVSPRQVALRAIGHTLYYTARDPVNGWEVRKTTGLAPSTSTTVAPLHITPQDPGETNFEVAGDHLYWFDNDPADPGAKKIWRSDGTPGNAAPLPGIVYTNPEADPELIGVNGTLYFGFDDEYHGEEMWMVDDTPPVVRSANFFGGAASQQNLQLTFSEKLGASLDPTDVSITPIGGGTTYSPINVSFSLLTKTATFNFGNTLPNGAYRATLAAGSVSDADGNATTTPFTWDFVLVSPGGNFALPAGTTKVNQVLVGDGGKLDVGTSTLIVDYAAASPVASIAAKIASGRNGGDWSGNGIITSAATSNLTTLGLAEASQVLGLAGNQTALFSSQVVDATTLIVKYTYGGDANLDGKINVDDYGHIDSSIPIGLTGFFNGDFNYDGKINVDDYGIIDFNIGIQGPPLSSSASVAATPRVARPPADTQDWTDVLLASLEL